MKKNFEVIEKALSEVKLDFGQEEALNIIKKELNDKDEKIKEFENESNLLEGLKIEYDNMVEIKETIIDCLEDKLKEKLRCRDTLLEITKGRLEACEDVLYEGKDKLEKIERYALRMIKCSDPYGDRFDEFNDILRIIKEE